MQHALLYIDVHRTDLFDQLEQIEISPPAACQSPRVSISSDCITFILYRGVPTIIVLQ